MDAQTLSMSHAETERVRPGRTRAVDLALTDHQFASFRFGQPRPQSLPIRGGHVRSHSRNASMSRSPVSFTFPPSLSAPALTTTSLPPPPTTDSAPPSPSRAKRNSHHRRQSSLSTRRESAEVMGVAATELRQTAHEEAADRDSIRRRALLALEGRCELGAFASMEIPQLASPEVEVATPKQTFTFRECSSLIASGNRS
jgi:hypothetical protein